MKIILPPGTHNSLLIEDETRLEFNATGWGQTLVNNKNVKKCIKGTILLRAGEKFTAFNASNQLMIITLYT